MIDNARNGIMDCPEIAAAPATAIRIGVPGIRIPNTATASTIAAANTPPRAHPGYQATNSTAASIQDHTRLTGLSQAADRWSAARTEYGQPAVLLEAAKRIQASG